MIAEAKAAKPDLPLEPAEEFLYTLSSIPELKARLSLLKFNYEFKQVEEVYRTSYCVCVCVEREGGMRHEQPWYVCFLHPCPIYIVFRSLLMASWI